jgi:hypothetical protein
VKTKFEIAYSQKGSARVFVDGTEIEHFTDLDLQTQGKTHRIVLRFPATVAPHIEREIAQALERLAFLPFVYVVRENPGDAIDWSTFPYFQCSEEAVTCLLCNREVQPETLYRDGGFGRQAHEICSQRWV